MDTTTYNPPNSTPGDPQPLGAIIATTADALSAGESGYRRGYCHGMNAAIEAIEAGADRKALCRLLDQCMEWRFSRPRGIVIPPVYGAKGAKR